MARILQHARAMAYLGIVFILSFAMVNGNSKVDLRMPSITPNQNEQYLCRSLKIKSSVEQNIIAFLPNATMHNVHHMLLYACAEPGSDLDVWDCRDMFRLSGPAQFPKARACNSFQRIIYAWANEAPELKLPQEKFEISCNINDDLNIHPFAFRVHTHAHGKMVSGYLIRNNLWRLIGKKDPQLPQMFYPMDDKNMIITAGDTLAARCTMINDDDKDVYIGPTADNEMCNFYLMYWVEGDRILSQNNCFSQGPPNYHWKNHLTNIPDAEASAI